MAWEEPPPLIPAAEEPAKPTPSAAPLLKPKTITKREEKISSHVTLVSQSGSAEKKKAVPSPSPTATPDPAKALAQLQSRRWAEEEALKLEKEQMKTE